MKAWMILFNCLLAMKMSFCT